MSQSLFVPKLWSSLREGYTREKLFNDLLAGLIVGIVALPLAIAFGIASGVKPEQGLFTAIVAGFIISLLSGSRVQIGGPTGAFIVIVFDIIREHGYDGLAIATFLAGGLLILMGLARLGGVIKFIPYPVTVGFTSGIALIIFLGQIRDLFGLQVAELPSEFFAKLTCYAEHLPSFSPVACLVGFATILIIFLWPRVTHRVPGSLVAILLPACAVACFDLPVATIGSRFGSVPTSLPIPHLPDFPGWERLTQLFSPALTIAILAGILVVVAWNMSEVHLFAKLLNGPRGDVLVLLSTFGLTVLVDLTVAIQVGMVLAAFLFMQRMADVTQVGFITRELADDAEEDPDDPKSLHRREVPLGVEVFEINGPFFFGAADKFRNAVAEISSPPQVLILRMRHVLTLDATALQALETVLTRTARGGTQLCVVRSPCATADGFGAFRFSDRDRCRECV